MCGIAGYFSSNGHIAKDVGERLLNQMLPKINHRGPDEHGLLVRDHAGIGHNRLSIIDLSTGRQPISNEKRDCWISFNGEIYNFKELKKSLTHHHFSTNTDTEVIVHLFEEMGPDAVKKLDGMFAFALLDGNELFLARDPLGIKPLYFAYGKDGKSLYFASEIKALMPYSFGIKEFPAGHWYHSKRGLHQYFKVSEQTGQPAETSENELPVLIKSIRQKLDRAVEKRLLADVPVGVFLSGGLDSSIIARIAKDYLGELHTFSVGTAESNDLKAARLVAKSLGTIHHEKIIDQQELFEALPQIIYHLESFDMALVRSAVANYFVSELASQYVKVVLCGEGADELFSGYGYLKDLSGNELHRELVEITENLHNTNLQRCDRMTMAHSIEGRVPFLDVSFLREAFSLPVSLKIRELDGFPVEKWLLREMFDDGILPKEVVWRRKEKFSIGCGAAHLLQRGAEALITESDLEQARCNNEVAGLVSREELFYFKIFRDFFPAKMAIHVGRTRSPEMN